MLALPPEIQPHRCRFTICGLSGGNADFGVSDAKYGEEVWAAVVLKGDASAEEIQAHCRSRLADFKVPKVIHIISALPKTATGKVQRRDLAALFKAAPK